jgi:4-amino-4-deoxy-L-arabinose transferase-like glycosyltransferase
MAVALTARERRGGGGARAGRGGGGRALALALAVIVAVRLATLGAYPLMDSTESRYAEIARKMLETGNWVMPQFEYGVPFWGKPPLSTWLSAASMAVFGVNEFAARLPSLLVMLGCGALVHALAQARGGRDQALWTLAPFAATGMVFIAAGAVMTDPALTFGTTLSMASFWIAVNGPASARRASGYAFFLGLAIGLLAKGPVAAVLTFVPIGVWTLRTRQRRSVWAALPWIAGTVLTAVLVVPWYWAAERATPGFLDYFLVGEHWKRFVEPGWKGDLYGAAHARPRGMIWVFWIAAALPWSVFALAWLGRAATGRRDDLRRLITDPWLLYLLLWTTTPMLFFTVSGNVLATYVLPGLPAFALLFAALWVPAGSGAEVLRPAVRTVAFTCLAFAAVFSIGIAVLQHRFEYELSHKALVRAYESRRGDAAGRLIYVGQRPVSAEFYAKGTLLRVTDIAALAPYLQDATTDFIVLRARDLGLLPEAIRGRLTPLGGFGEYQLFREQPPSPATP